MDNPKYVVFLILLLSGCSHPNADKGTGFATIVVEENAIVISPESNKEIVSPTFIRTGSDYILIYEYKSQKIVKLTYEGEQLLSFGGKGRGPGEFLSLTNYWIMEDHYLLYDYNGAKMVLYDFDGSLIDEYSVNIGALTGNVEVLSTDKFVSPAKGKEGSLLKISNLKNEEIIYFGDAVAGPNEVSTEKISQIIQKGGVPNYMQNYVFIAVNESGIFCFQSTKAVLQKYNKDGVLLWQRDLNIPVLEGVYENYLKKNREEEYIYSLTYALGIQAVEDGVAVLFNTTDDKPTTVAWIPNEGNNIRLIKYPAINNSAFILRFQVAPEHNTVFFVMTLEGKVLKSDWPIENNKHS